MISDILIVVILLFLWAFFAGSETAFISTDRLKLKNLEKKGVKNAKIALFLIEKPERLLITVLMGTNISLVLAANLTAKIFYEIYGKHKPLSSIVILTLISLILCEILPKNIAFKNNFKFTLFTSYPLYISYIIFYPAVFVLSIINRVIIKLIGIPYTGLIPSLFKKKEDIKLFLISSIGKKFSRDQSRYFVESLDFSYKKVSDIQIPLVDIKALQTDSKVRDAISFFSKTHKSIVPIYKNRIDNIVGVVFSNDLIGVDKNLELSEVMREPYFIPENRLINDLYSDMYKNDILAVFGVDEHGGITGMATLYDLGEEIIGKITNIDEKKNLILKISNKEYLFDGDVEIDDINHLLNLNIASEDFTTLNGFITKRLGKIPIKGDKVEFEGYRFVVEKSTKRRAELIRAIKI